jgi:hypothetical protein
MSSPLGRAPEMQFLGDRDEITEMPEFHGPTQGVDPLGTLRRHRKNPMGARRLRSACSQARMSDSSCVDDTAKVSKRTRPNIGPSHAPLPIPGRERAAQAKGESTRCVPLEKEP